MATIDNKEVVDRLIANDGWYDTHDKGAPDNPRAQKIVRYVNAWGRDTWGVVFAGDYDPDRYEVETEYVRKPQVIWVAT